MPREGRWAPIFEIEPVRFAVQQSGLDHLPHEQGNIDEAYQSGRTTANDAPSRSAKTWRR